MLETIALGTCRVRGLASLHVPCRMHTTREVLQLLHGLGDAVGGRTPLPDLSYVFGDSQHPMVRGEWESFLRQAPLPRSLPPARALVLEVSSTRYATSALYEGAVLNAFYVERDGMGPRLRAQTHVQSRHEVWDDLKRILVACESLGIERLMLLPHLSLPPWHGQPVLAVRARLRDLLWEFAATHAERVSFLDVDGAFGPHATIESVCCDGVHYTPQAEACMVVHVRAQIERVLSRSSPLASCAGE